MHLIALVYQVKIIVQANNNDPLYNVGYVRLGSKWRDIEQVSLLI